MIGQKPKCLECKHFNDLALLEFKHTCKAFEEIPDRVWAGENDHAEPLPEQENEIVFEPVENK